MTLRGHPQRSSNHSWESHLVETEIDTVSVHCQGGHNRSSRITSLSSRMDITDRHLDTTPPPPILLGLPLSYLESSSGKPHVLVLDLSTLFSGNPRSHVWP
ncbi:hypothetical protein FA13DRAFT_1737899 [Coprinellus micaceus]|uniref:Uncharacterized protein n=1 Tax=Coprinellus micaceus TaxID=71717 RepID=A0A4Y7SWJ7_COPMI|nr:hypothetical protein FA13DRAFT_1737899 [Coprinellus micaceus]